MFVAGLFAIVFIGLLYTGIILMELRRSTITDVAQMLGTNVFNAQLTLMRLRTAIEAGLGGQGLTTLLETISANPDAVVTLAVATRFDGTANELEQIIKVCNGAISFGTPVKVIVDAIEDRAKAVKQIREEESF